MVKDSNGTPLRGLTADRFRAFQGKDQCNILSVDSDPEPLTILLMFDWSGSSRSYLDKQTREDISDAIKKYVGLHLKGPNMAALSMFADRAAGAGEFTNDPQQFAKQMLVLMEKQPMGSTALWDAIEWADGKLRRFNQDRIIVLVSDGADNESRRTPDTIEKELVEDHIR